MKLQKMSMLAVGLLLLVALPALAREWTDNTGKVLDRGRIGGSQGRQGRAEEADRLGDHNADCPTE